MPPPVPGKPPSPEDYLHHQAENILGHIQSQVAHGHIHPDDLPEILRRVSERIDQDYRPRDRNPRNSGSPVVE